MRDFQLLKSYIPRIGFNLYAVLGRSKRTKETHFRDATSVYSHATSRVLFTGTRPTSLPSVRILYLGHHLPVLDQPIYNSVKRKKRKIDTSVSPLFIRRSWIKVTIKILPMLTGFSVFFPQNIQENADDVFQIPPWPPPSTFSPINYSPTILPYGTITLYYGTIWHHKPILWHHNPILWHHNHILWHNMAP
jgi:hypothetical protein